VADTRNNRVQVFKYDQTLDAWAFQTKWGAVGPGDGQFKFPSGIAVGTDRTVYVADTVNNRVQVFKYDQASDAWAFHTKWGKIGTGEGQFYNPYGIAVDAVDYVYVADTLNSRLQVFSNSGGFIGKWNIPQPDHIGALPRGIAVDPAGYLYVTDSVDPYDRVLVIAGTGSSPTAWTLKAEWNEIYLSNAWGIALDGSEPCTSKVYVADERSSRILVLQGFGGTGGGTQAITCPADINVLTDQCSAVVTYEVTATDGCSEVPVVVDPPSGSAFPIGTTSVTATAGDIGTCTFNVTVEEEVPPTINNISANPSVLWPANHKMVPVAVAVSASDNCDAAPVCRITSVSSNERVDGLGDGDTAPDWEITGNLTVNLRAERSGTGSDRVYTIAAQCTDVSGNSSTTTVAVTVPHDQKKE